MGYTLIITNPDEPVVQLVLNELETLRQPYFIFYPHLFPIRDFLSFSFDGSLGGKLTICGISRPLCEIESVWYWKPLPAAQKSENVGYKKFIQNESRAALWSLYTSLEDRVWINDLLRANKLIEDNKMYQLRAAESIGLTIPATLISNDPREVKYFVSKHQKVAAKQLYTQVFLDEGDPLLLYTNVITQQDVQGSERQIAACPLFLQEYVEKAYELRITVVGERVFSAKIDSQSLATSQHDWRKAGNELSYIPYSLPEEVSAKIKSLVKNLGLIYGAIDMIVTPDGDYVFLEINPNGRWGWIQDSCNFNIAKSLAEKLTKK
ncbi:MAG: hypothetical protein WD579_00390 [Candidatus Paceibacterota bacterium]